MLTLALVAFGAAAGLAKDNASASRAEEVLKQARAALGGESKIGGVRGLSVKGKFRRVMGEREMSGEREFDLLLPDKFMRSESLVMPGMATSITTSRAVSGQEFWSSGGGRPGGMVFIMRGDGREPTAEDKARAEQEQARQMRAEMARYVLALLLTPTPNFPVEFSYFGEATADDGAADVIDAAGPEGFAARLFLDKQTHLPLMLSYRAPKPRVVTMVQPGGRGGGAGAHGGKTPEELVKEAQDKLKAEGESKPEEVEMQIRFSDYKESGGLLLPHHIAMGPDGETNEEWEIKSYTLNPQFKADKFQKK